MQITEEMKASAVRQMSHDEWRAYGIHCIGLLVSYAIGNAVK